MNGIISSYSNYIAKYNKPAGNGASSDYLSQLQAKHNGLTITAASSMPDLNSIRGKVNILTIHPSILQKMQNNPEEEKYYEQRIKDIEGSINTINALHEGMGFRRTTSFDHIDENGEIWGGAIVERKDTLNERLREEASENRKVVFEKIREKSKETRNNIEAEMLEKFAEKFENSIPDTKNSHNEAFHVSISDEAKQLYLQSKPEKPMSQQKPFFKIVKTK